MVEFINNLIEWGTGYLAILWWALFFIPIGYIVIKFKGGLPLVKGKILAKPKTILIVVPGFLLIVALSPTVIDALAKWTKQWILDSPGSFFPSLIILGAVALRTFDKGMKHNFSIYWKVPLAMGLLGFMVWLMFGLAPLL